MDNHRDTFKERPKNLKKVAIRSAVVHELRYMPRTSFAEKKAYSCRVKQLAGENHVTEKTIRNWAARFDKGGFNALSDQYPSQRHDRRIPLEFDTWYERAKEIRAADPSISVDGIIYILKSEFPNSEGRIKRSTLQRHLFEDGYGSAHVRKLKQMHGRQVHGRFQKKHRMELLVLDGKEPAHCTVIDSNGNYMKIYILIILDNFSRAILDYRICTKATAEKVLEGLYAVIAAFGRPDKIQIDNGANYVADNVKESCRNLGIKISRCAVHAPASKGSLERVNSTLDQILIPLSSMKGISFEVVDKAFNQYVYEYNNTPHKNPILNGRTPMEAFCGDDRPFKPVDRQWLEESFSTTVNRKVQKDGTVSIDGFSYQVDVDLAPVGSRVTLIKPLMKSYYCQKAADGTLIDVLPLEIGENVPKRVFKKHEPAVPTLNLEGDYKGLNPYVAATLRQYERRKGTYKDEESFMAKVHAETNTLPDDVSTEAAQPAGNGAGSQGTAPKPAAPKYAPSAYRKAASYLKNRNSEENDK